MNSRAVVLATLIGVFAGGCGEEPTEPAQLRLLISPDSAALEVGERLQLQVQVVDAEGATIDDLLPARSLRWTVSDPYVLRLASLGEVEGRRPGRATVRAEAEALDAIGTAAVEVHLASPDSISLAPSALALVVGDSARVTALVFDRRGARIRVFPDSLTLTWMSSDKAIASVDDFGIARSRGLGRAVITARLGDLEASLELVTRPVPPLVLYASQVLLTRLGESVTVTGTVEDEPVETLMFKRLEEQRWLDDVAVAVPADGVQNTLVARGPGTVRFAVSVPLALPDTLTARVQPLRPLVIAVANQGTVGDGDTLVLRGYRTDELTAEAVTVGADRATRIDADSANLYLSIPTARPTTCQGSARAALSVEGADLAPDLWVRRKRAGDLLLEPGTAIRLTATELACLRLPAMPGSAYDLAFFDSTYLAIATNDREPQPTEQNFAVWVEDLSSEGAGTVSRPLVGLEESTVDLSPAAESALGGSGTTPQDRSSAQRWQVGDVFERQYGDEPLEVVAIYRDYLVIAVPVSLTDGFTDEVREVFRAASEFVLDEGIPLYRRLLVDTLPASEPSPDQFLVIAEPVYGTGLTQGAAGSNGIVIRYDPERLPFEVFLHVLAHELAHTWHFQYNIAARARGEPVGDWVKWSVEGLADYLAHEVEAVYWGFTLFENVDWREPPQLAYYSEVWQARGRFLDGYTQSSGLLRDLTWRLVRKQGLGEEEAARLVSRGASQGWYGCEGPGSCEALGLTERMRDQFGGSWDPVGAMLVWALSQAGDDVSSSAEFDNPSYLRAGRDPDDQITSRGWPEAAELTVGDGAVVQAAQRAGGLGFIRLEDDGVGGSLRLQSSGADVAWMLRRTDTVND